MGRIVKGDLLRVVERINEATGHPLEPWTKDKKGKYRPNGGVYLLDWCYGGVRLNQMCEGTSGQRDLTARATARETYYRLQAFLAGIEAAKGLPVPPVPHGGY